MNTIHRRRLRLRHAAVALIATAMAATSCSGASAKAPSTSGEPSGGSEVAIESCGLTFKVKPPVGRAVGTSLPPIEIMLALGLKDRLVGAPNIGKSFLPQYQADFNGVPIIAKGAFPPPSKEAVLGVRPDIVVAGYPDDFGEEALGDRKQLLNDGLPSYLSAGSCPNQAMKIEHSYTDIENIGKIFKVEDKAKALNDQVRAEVAQAKKVDQPLSVLTIVGKPEKPSLMGSNDGSFSMLTTLGAKPLYADRTDYSTLNWETVVKDNPDVILIKSIASAPGDATVTWIKNYPPLAEVKAVKNNRFIVMPVNDFQPGLRVGKALMTLSKGLHGQ